MSKKIRSFIKSQKLDKLVDIVESGEDVYFNDRSGNSFLHICAQYGSIEIFKYLHHQKVDISQTNKKGLQPLHSAAENGQLEIVKYCIKHHNDINLSDKYNSTPLYIAVYNGHLDVVKFLVDSGANLNDTFDNEANLLIPAIRSNYMPLVKYLLSKGLDVNHRQTGGWSQVPLDHAASQGIEIVKCLLDHGADVNTLNSYEKTPLFSYIQNDHITGAELLLNAGADIHISRDSGKTLLMHALWMNNVPAT
ncbi:MAG: ankyrin repeat protein [Maribacter sp.]|jgi:ankyrin repeat protein